MKSLKNRAFIICLAILTLLSVVSASVLAADATNSFEKPPISIAKATSSISIDDSALEADWTNTMNYASIIDQTKTAGAWVPGQPEGCATVDTLKFLWDENFIYVYISVKDSTISALSTTTYNNDSVEYFIDATNCDKPSYNGVDDGQYRLGRDGTISGMGGYNAITFATNSKSVSTDTGYTQEIKIALADQGVTTALAEGQSIGIDVQVNDAKDGTRTWQLVWNSKDVGWANPSSMGTVNLAATVATPTPQSTATPEVTPTPPILGAVTVKLNKTTAAIKVPQTLQLNATVSIPYIADDSVKWTSSNAKVATVSSSGKVTAKSAGVATITATTVTASKKATCKVTVTQPITSVKLNKATLTISKGKTAKLIATINPSSASNKKVTWKTSNKSIATVTSTGIVKGIKKGTAYIYVYSVDGNKSSKCKVTIK